MDAGKPDRKRTVFVMIDVQEKFVPVIRGVKDVIRNANILVKASEILRVPLLVTEQYPKGLGKTVNGIKVPKPIEKMEFSCFGCREFVRKLDALKVKDVVIFGIEAHVCVLKTALDALEKGCRVHVVADAVSSRTKDNKELAIERMRQSGIYVVTTEMILFQLMDKAGTDEFKKISRLVK